MQPSAAAALWLTVVLLTTATATGSPAGPYQRPSWRGGRFCRKHPTNCGLMERAMPDLLAGLSRRPPLAAVSLRDVFRLSVLTLLRHGADKAFKTADELRSLVERDITGVLRPLKKSVSDESLAAVAAMVVRNTPKCYSVTGEQLQPAWTVYVNFATSQPSVKATLADFKMRVQLQAATEAWQQTTFSLPRWIAMLWIDGMRQSLLQRAQCGLKKGA